MCPPPVRPQCGGKGTTLVPRHGYLENDGVNEMGDTHMGHTAADLSFSGFNNMFINSIDLSLFRRVSAAGNNSQDLSNSLNIHQNHSKCLRIVLNGAS